MVRGSIRCEDIVSTPLLQWPCYDINHANAMGQVETDSDASERSANKSVTQLSRNGNSSGEQCVNRQPNHVLGIA